MSTESEESFMRLPTRIIPKHYAGPPEKEKRRVSPEQTARGRYFAYGLTLERTDAMLKYQNEACAICLRKFKRRRFHVDHCHKTKKVRGLLCPSCNCGLGMFRDRPDVLASAIAYLRGGLTGPCPTGARGKEVLIIPTDPTAPVFRETET